MTIILASHNFAEASAVSDRVAVLQNGELLGLRDASNISVESLQRYYREATEGMRLREWPEGVPA